MNQDPDSVTRAELADLLERGDWDALDDRFSKRIAFGTAGLRGELGAGPNRMNRVLVAQAALGLARYLREKFPNQKPSIAIGFDGRVNSDVFARDSAQIMAAAGIEVLLFENYCPTPLLAFAVMHKNLSAGVMVTASHNPPRDNGYKVYLGGANGGSQIISPADKEIAAKIQDAADSITFDAIPKSNDFEIGGEDVRDAYVVQTASLVHGIDALEPIDVVFTAMHGVGWATLKRVFERAGMALPLTVKSQNEPDGTFPTVSFPNPEEPGAMDLAFALADNVEADLVIANDPDADRVAVGIRDPEQDDLWRKLTGDEVGLILGDWATRRALAAGRTGNLAVSIASSSALKKVAESNGLGFVETLTGFKWITKVDELIFGYEEALGYCLDPEHVPDKDGISAALVLASIATELATRGQTLLSHLGSLQEKYGHIATGQITVRVAKIELTDATMAKLRTNPPREIDGSVAALTDFSLGEKLPPTDGLRFELSDGRRVLVRPSGTEPKLKCYLQAAGSTQEEAKRSLASLDAAMRLLLG
ncbi:MAG: hypothetical protein RLZZ400_342 [Actinomycetota bacterium]